MWNCTMTCDPSFARWWRVEISQRLQHTGTDGLHSSGLRTQGAILMQTHSAMVLGVQRCLTAQIKIDTIKFKAKSSHRAWPPRVCRFGSGPTADSSPGSRCAYETMAMGNHGNALRLSLLPGSADWRAWRWGGLAPRSVTSTRMCPIHQIFSPANQIN